MQSSSELWLGLTLWLLIPIGVFIAQACGRLPRAGLVLAYILNLSIIHWGGALVHALPWYTYRSLDIVAAGFSQSLFGMIAFGVGAVLLAPTLRDLIHPTAGAGVDSNDLVDMLDSGIPRLYVTIGLCCYLVVFPLLGGLPTVTSIVSSLNQLLLVGLGLGCWMAWRSGDRRTFAIWLVAAFGLPLLTIVLQGFLGFGVVALSTLLLFVASFIRPSWKTLVLMMLIAYLGISFYVTYMRDRTDIRASVWGGQSLNQRVSRIYDSFSTIEWFDPNNQSHLRRIDERLNQNILVGTAVYNLSSGYREFARGETLRQAVQALIPRALWPEKPVSAGSPGIVTAYTGIQFAPGTSVGVGQVLELYINFGTAGVVVGFLALGVLVGLCDMAAAQNLVGADWRRFTFWYLPGLGFLQSGGSLVEVSATVGAGFVTALLITRLIIPALRMLANPRGIAFSDTRHDMPDQFSAAVRPATELHQNGRPASDKPW